MKENGSSISVHTLHIFVTVQIFFFFFKVALLVQLSFKTEKKSTRWRAAFSPHYFKRSRPLSPAFLPLPSATVSVIVCEAPVILDTNAGLNVHAEGPSMRSWIPTFGAEGRISFSKCLAGKYVIRLETDPVKNRWDVFKPVTGECAIYFFSHTHWKVKSVNLLPAEVFSVTALVRVKPP